MDGGRKEIPACESLIGDYCSQEQQIQCTSGRSGTKIRLCNDYGHCLSVSNNTVFASPLTPRSPYSYLTVERSGGSAVRIRGSKVRRYVSVDSEGTFRPETDGSAASTLFMERKSSGNNKVFFSVRNRPNRFIGIDKKGRVRHTNDNDIDTILFKKIVVK